MCRVLAQAVQFLVFYRQLAVSQRSNVIASPDASRLMRYIDKELIRGVKRVWERATLYLDGNRVDTAPEHTARLAEVMHRASAFQAEEGLPSVFADIGNLAVQLLGFVSWCIQHPDEDAAITYALPRTQARIDLLIAARRFVHDSETPEEARMLKRETNCSQLARVRVAPERCDAILLQSPSAYILVNYEQTAHWDKEHVTESTWMMLLREERYI